MKTIIMTVLFCTSFMASANIHQIYDTENKKYIDFSDLLDSTPAQGHFVLGEFHNDQLIQKAQATIIREKTKRENAQNNFSVLWEFLNHTEQDETEFQFQKLLNNEITSIEFIANTAGSQNKTYAQIIDELKNLNGDIYGINIPRSVKQIVVKEGIGAIDQNLVPHHHYDGDQQYKERFITAMGGHVPSSKVDAYFTAQCLTDSVMADEITKNVNNSLNFVIAGSFHTDFFNGTVQRLAKLIPTEIVSFKLINQNSLSQEQIEDILNGHKKYGQYADYIIIVR